VIYASGVSRRSFAVAACGALAAVAVAAAAAPASTVPDLRSVSASHRHVVVVFTTGELAPRTVQVATRPQRGRDGSFVAVNVRLNELMRPTRVAAGYRSRTRGTLRPGRYYVAVSANEIALDCTPHKPCKTSWSNVRSIRVP
jgi:hypothetical protein